MAINIESLLKMIGSSNSVGPEVVVSLKYAQDLKEKVM